MRYRETLRDTFRYKAYLKTRLRSSVSDTIRIVLAKYMSVDVPGGRSRNLNGCFIMSYKSLLATMVRQFRETDAQGPCYRSIDKYGLATAGLCRIALSASRLCKFAMNEEGR